MGSQRGFLRVFQILVEDAVLRVGAVPHADDEIPPIFRHAPVETPLFSVGSLIDEDVFRLRRAQMVVVEFLVVVCSLKFLPWQRFIVAAVKKAFVVVQPRRSGKFGPLQMVGKVFARRHLANPPFQPIRAGSG